MSSRHLMSSGGRPRSATLVAVAAVAALLAAVTPQSTAVSPAVAATSASPSTADPAPELTASAFAEPPNTVRPKYRWWMPMAFTDDDELRAEIADMAEVGAGGIEVATTTVEGPRSGSQAFLTEYGWGSPLWAEKVELMMMEAAEHDLGLDLTIGPRWPAIVPTVTDVNDPRAAQQLVYSHAFVPGGSTYDGSLPTNYEPRPPSGAERTLVAVVLARCAEPDCRTQSAGPRLLDRESVQDVTAQVTPDGRFTGTVPGDASETWTMISFFQTGGAGSRSNFTTTKRNYLLDHLSVQGAEASTEFFDSAILTPGVRDAMRDVGRVDLFEDSLELGDEQRWTWDFVEQWEERRGYSPIEVLPALAGAGDEGLTDATFFDFSDGTGARIRTDYRQTWSDLYIDARLDTLRAWANDRGINLRSQPYGSAIDTAEASTHVDVPEGESLVFGQNVEDFKVVAVGAHLTGGAVVSNECCAATRNVWATTAGGAEEPANLQAVYRWYAGGATQIVWHGYPYLTRGEGTSEQTVWPGMSYGGNSSFAEGWGDKGGPNWQDYRAVNDHLARLQLVLRQGSPEFDVAVYLQDFGLRGGATALSATNRLLRSDSTLAEHGYTYEYLSPAHLRLPGAEVSEGQLFPGAGGFEALVLNEQDTLAVDTAERLLRLARSGLPIVVVGGLPTRVPGYHDAKAQDARLAGLVRELAGLPGVRQVDDLLDVPAALADAGVDPAAGHARRSADLLSVRRSDDATDYYYLFNQATWATEQQVTLEGEGRPYELDTWTGEITPISDFRTVPGGVEVDVALEPADAKVIALSTRRDDTFRWHRTPDPRRTVARNDGLGPVVLDAWSLDVESWTPGPSGLPGDTTRTDVPTIEPSVGDHGALPPWSEVTPANGYDADLGDVSGVGTYRSTFTLDESWDEVRGAHLDLGKVVDTATVTVNGTEVPGLDPQDLSHVEVGDYLRAGENTITVRVSSTLLNAVRVAPGTEAAGRDPLDYGLLGPVRLEPYDAREPTLTVEALEDELPLAQGARNNARIRITNNANAPTTVDVAAVGGTGTVATPDRTRIRLPGRASVTTGVRLVGAQPSGTSDLAVDVTAAHGAHDEAHVAVRHTDDAALNTSGSPYPRAWSSTAQDKNPVSWVNDGDPSTFWVSGGAVPGQGPTADRPEFLGVELAEPTEIGAIATNGRGNWSPRRFDVQVSLDGRTWSTVATVESPKNGRLTSFAPVEARYVRLRITEAWTPETPSSNTQVAEFRVHAAPTG
jgi:hypothetical protein